MRSTSSSPMIPPKIAVIFGIIAVSAASIFIRFAQEEAGSIVIAAHRLGIATLVLAPITSVRYRQELQSLSRGDLLLGLLSGVFLAIHFATWITSLEFTTVASSVVIVTTTPLWVALLSPLVLREPISLGVKIGLMIALVGTVVIGLSDICEIQEGFNCPPAELFFSGRAVWGDFLSLLGAWGAAGYVMIGRKIRAKLPLIPYITLVYGVAALILSVLMFAGSDSVYGFSPSTYLWLVLLALVPQLLGHSTFNWALGYLSAAFVSISLLGEPIGSTILAYILLQETPTPLKIFGAVLILVGIILASQDNSTENSEA
jgi:drug/metabolite transporter (DMT)-like permease